MDNTVFDKTEDQFTRTRRLIGQDLEKKLKTKCVAVFGLGGVGSFVVEALARVGIENLLLVDNDRITQSNLNRQLFALHSTEGKLKTECAINRIRDINPSIKVKGIPIFYEKTQAKNLDKAISECDYIVDAIDTVSAKILLIEKAQEFGVPIISCMGTGNKMDASGFEITNIEKTSVCPLAKVMRRELKMRGIRKIKVIYSKEKPIKASPPASISFVPSVAGLLIAGEVVRDLIKS